MGLIIHNLEQMLSVFDDMVGMVPSTPTGGCCMCNPSSPNTALPCEGLLKGKMVYEIGYIPAVCHFFYSILFHCFNL